MGRAARWLLAVVGLAVVAALASGVVLAATAVSRWTDEDRWLDSGGTTAEPTAAQVDAVLRFAALAGLPPGAVVGPLRVEQGIDGFAALTVRMAPEQVGPWLAASAMPPLEFPATGPAVVPQHRSGRPGGGIVFRSAVVVAAGVVEVRAFET